MRRGLKGIVKGSCLSNHCIRYGLYPGKCSMKKTALCECIAKEKIIDNQASSVASSSLRNEMDKITVLTATSGRPDKLRRFLDGLISADGFQTIDVIILHNGHERETEKILRSFSAKYRNIIVLQSEHCNRGKARNILINEAKGEVLYFLDDDVVIKPDAFCVLRDYLKRYPHIGIMGGINRTPRDSSYFQRAQGYAFGSFFGTLWVSLRYFGLEKATLTDERFLILCNLAMRRAVFMENGTRFPEHIICAEENVVLQELSSRGIKALHIPELIVFHERRKNLYAFCQQVFTYGRGRCQAIKYLRKINNICYLIPSTFLLYLCSLLIVRQPIYRIPLYVYLLLCIVSSFYLMIKTKNVISSLITIILFPATHIAYGFGFLFEIFSGGLTLSLFSYFQRRHIEEDRE